MDNVKNIYKEEFSFLEINKMSFDIFKENFKNIFLIAVIIYLPISTILSIADKFLLSSNLMLYIKMASWLEILVWIIASLFVTFLVKANLEKQTKNFKELLNLSLSNYGKWIWIAIIFSIYIWLLILLLIIPWIIFSVFWIFCLQVVIFNKTETLSESLAYSKKLVKWRWWNLFGYWFGYFLVQFTIWFLSWLIILLLTWFFNIDLPNYILVILDIFTTFIVNLVSLYFIIMITLKFVNIDSIVHKVNETLENDELVIIQE